MKPSALLQQVSVSLFLVLAGCSSVSAPRWLWPFGEEESATATAAAPVAPRAATLAPGDDAVLGFHERAEAFYQRLAQRRFNTLATYNDPTLRGYFETQEGYSDYYARLAEELTEARFEKNRPLLAELQEFSMETPGRARVRFRLVGKSSRPLRFWSVSIEREDVWEQKSGHWWIVPGKL
jgi:hypothetical protein